MPDYNILIEFGAQIVYAKDMRSFLFIFHLIDYCSKTKGIRIKVHSSIYFFTRYNLRVNSYAVFSPIKLKEKKNVEIL